MEKKTFWAIACLFGLLSCQPSETISPPVIEEKYPVHFTLYLNEEVLPFPATKGIPAFDIPEPIAVKSDTKPSTDEKEVSDLCQAIEYIVYDNNQHGDTLRHRTYIHGEEDFGIVYDSLPAGNYTVAFLAHSSVYEELTDSVISFKDVSDTFWKKIPLPVQQRTEINKDITLGRVVSRIEFVAKDTVPKDLKSFHIKSEPRYDRMNVITGKGVPTNTSYTLSHTFTPEEIGKAGLSFGFLTFVPSPEDPLLLVTLTAKETGETERYSKTISSVTPFANRLVRYSGYLYTPPASDDTFTLKIDDKWNEPDEHQLDD